VTAPPDRARLTAPPDRAVCLHLTTRSDGWRTCSTAHFWMPRPRASHQRLGHSLAITPHPETVAAVAPVAPVAPTALVEARSRRDGVRTAARTRCANNKRNEIHGDHVRHTANLIGMRFSQRSKFDLGLSEDETSQPATLTRLPCARASAARTTPATRSISDLHAPSSEVYSLRSSPPRICPSAARP